MSTTVMAVILGIILVTAIHPGKPTDKESEIQKVLIMNLWSHQLVFVPNKP